MYAYNGKHGSLLDELGMVEGSHRHAIFKKIALLEGKPIDLVKDMGFIGGPFYHKSPAFIYGIRVHAPQRMQYRIPFALFQGSYMLLTWNGRDNLDFDKLTMQALERYYEVYNDPQKYEKFEPLPA